MEERYEDYLQDLLRYQKVKTTYDDVYFGFLKFVKHKGKEMEKKFELEFHRLIQGDKGDGIPVVEMWLEPVKE